MAKKSKDDTGRWEEHYWDSHNYNYRKNIKSGTYLHSYCPFCSKEITRGNALPFEVVNQDGEVGIVELSPYLNTFQRHTDIRLSEGEDVKDLRCPHCHKSLKVEGMKCGHGDLHVASFLVGISNSKVPFFICMKVGCTWHAISPEDESKIILDDSDEW